MRACLTRPRPLGECPRGAERETFDPKTERAPRALSYDLRRLKSRSILKSRSLFASRVRTLPPLVRGAGVGGGEGADLSPRFGSGRDWWDEGGEERSYHRHTCQTVLSLTVEG